ncbi:MAG: C4-dicarboxylate ABC transporter [Firmicutes bacterium]|nr:C4-dicarboxylate ABC transporter [Bacillota bacterium]
MSLGVIALIALLVIVVISCISERNVGIMCIAAAFLLATFSGGVLKVDALNTFFPIKLFMILVGATFLFSMATINGTVAKMAQWAVKGSGGSVGMIPIIFCILSCVLSAIGPGNIATTVVLAPIGMALAGETRISPFLMTLMIVNGANAGALSPLAPTGIIANGLVEKIKLEYIGNQIFLNSLLGNGVASLLAYVGFGGLKLWGAKVDPGLSQRVKDIVSAKIEPWDKSQLITLAAIATWIILVLVFKWDVGFTALVLGVVLSFLNVADEKKAMAAQPWFTMFMLVGVMVLVEVCGKLGGLEYATSAIARISTTNTISAIFGGLTGFVSTYSGSSAVVMPTFVPLIPGLVQKLGVVGPDAIDLQRNLVYTCCVSAHLVDASPLSLLGALCIAAAPEWEDKNKLFRNLLIWGVSMAAFAALISFIFWR